MRVSSRLLESRNSERRVEEATPFPLRWLGAGDGRPRAPPSKPSRIPCF